MTDARHLSDTYKRGSQYLAVVNITILIYLAIKSVFTSECFILYEIVRGELKYNNIDKVMI